MITELPTESLLHILSFLPLDSLYQLSLVATTFNQFIADPMVNTYLTRKYLSNTTLIPTGRALYYARYFTNQRSITKRLTLSQLEIAIELGLEKVIIRLYDGTASFPKDVTSYPINIRVGSRHMDYNSLSEIRHIYILTRAAEYNHVHVINLVLKNQDRYKQLIISHGIVIPWLAIPTLTAAHTGNLSLVKYLVNRMSLTESELSNSDIEQISTIFPGDLKTDVFNSLLQAAIIYNQWKIVEYLLMEATIFKQMYLTHISQRTMQTILFHCNSVERFKLVYFLLNRPLDEWWQALPAIRYNMYRDGLAIYQFVLDQIGKERAKMMELAVWNGEPSDYERRLYNKWNSNIAQTINEMKKLGQWVRLYLECHMEKK